MLHRGQAGLHVPGVQLLPDDGTLGSNLENVLGGGPLSSQDPLSLLHSVRWDPSRFPPQIWQRT